MGFPGGSVVTNPPANAEDLRLIPELERSPGSGMATPSKFLPEESPWTEESCRLQSMGLQKSQTQLND